MLGFAGTFCRSSSHLGGSGLDEHRAAAETGGKEEVGGEEVKDYIKKKRRLTVTG